MKHIVSSLLILIGTAVITASAVRAQENTPTRTLKICVAADAPAAVQEAARAVLAAVPQQPLLQAMTAGGAAPTNLTDSAALQAADPESRAYSHLILVGLPTDPLIHEAWQREAKSENGGFYIYGFGRLRGDIGYIESDRNPYLHGAAIKRAPFETEIVTLTGSTPAGVALAVRAFLKNGLVNGVVAAPSGWTRAGATLLDHDPVAPDFALPTWVPAQLGSSAQRIGVTQASEEEYRGVLADTDVEPLSIWRVKYYHPGDWDSAGAKMAEANYSSGLHRRAYGNTLWCARFKSAADAAAAAPKIAAAAKLSLHGSTWEGRQGSISGGNDYLGGPLTLYQRGEWVVMSTLPTDDTRALLTANTSGARR